MFNQTRVRDTPPLYFMISIFHRVYAPISQGENAVPSSQINSLATLGRWSSSSASQAISLVFTILGEIFAYVTAFNPTIEVFTFRLRGWCMLGVFLLPAFTRLGHEHQDLLSPHDGMHVCTD